MEDRQDTAGDEARGALAPREKRFLVARLETRALRAIAERLPARVMPDHMTALGLFAAIGIAAAYVLSNESPLWLFAASALIVVHWLGDSLDGTLARVRGIERPRYGYYLDHLMDGFSTVLIGIGLGLSPFLLLSTGLAVVVAYLLLSINVYLETETIGRFRLDYGLIGPTEARIGLIALNTVMAFGVGSSIAFAGLDISILDLAAWAIAGAMLAALGVRAFGNLRRLAKLEPSGRAA